MLGPKEVERMYKGYIYFRVLLISLLMVLCFGCAEKITQGSDDKPVEMSVYIQNNTSDSFAFLFFSLPGIANWSNGIEFSRSVSIPTSFIDNQGKTDILLRAHYSDGYKWYTRFNQAITQNGTIIFTDSDIEPTTTVIINNNTQTYLNTGYARFPGLFGWTELSNNQVSPNNTRSENIPNFCIDSQGKVDIQMMSYDHSMFTKLRQPISQNGVIIFSTSDIEPSTSINILNNTEFDIGYINVRLPDTNNWRELYYGISSGSTRTISISSSFIDNQNRTDLQLVRETFTGYSVIFSKTYQYIVAYSSIEFSANDLDSSSPIPVTIKNNAVINSDSVCYFKLPGTKHWYGLGYIFDSTGLLGIPSFVISNSSKSDIQIRTDGEWFTKLNQTITYNGLITFTTSDIEPTSRFSIQNNTGLDIYTCSLRIPGSSIWEYEEYIGLDNNQSRFITVPQSAINNQNRSDIQLKSFNGVLFTKLNHTIATNGTLTFTESDFDATGNIPLTIINNTTVDIYAINFKLPGTSEWRLLTSSSYVLIYSGGSRSVSISSLYINSQGRTDLQLLSLDGLLYTKLNQDVIPFSSIPFTTSDFDPTGSRLLYIENNIGVSIQYGYAKLPGTTDWTRLFSATVSDGGTRAIGIPQILINNQERSDLQLQTSDGVWYTKTDQVITSNGIITFTASDFDPSGSRPITIQNNTGDYISYGYARLPGSTSWVNIFSSYYIPNGSSQTVIIPLSCIDSESKTDIQLRTSDYSGAVLYTKLNQIVTVNGTITFTAGDIDPRRVTIVNNTGVYISYGYVRLPGTTSWSSLSLYGLSNGSSQQVSISSVYLDNQSRADLQLRGTSSSGVIYTRLSQNISHNGTVTFTAGDIDADSPYPVTIQNNTGYTINYGYARLPGTVNWVNLFTSTLSNGASTATVIPLSVISNSRTDLQLRTSSGVWFSKLNYVITVNGTITFLASDIDAQ